MAKPTKHSAAKVISAVRGSKGIKKIVCLRLGISRPTFDGYIRRWKSVEEAFKAEMEDLLDEAEFAIADAVVSKRCLKTSKWLLSLRGSSRGYVRPSPAPPGRPEDAELREVRWVEPPCLPLPVEDEGAGSLDAFLRERPIKRSDLGLDGVDDE